MFSIPWSIGACVDADGRNKFDVFFKELISGKQEEFPMPKALGTKLDVPIPDNMHVYEIFYEVS